jgi:hypothetical protein
MAGDRAVSRLRDRCDTRDAGVQLEHPTLSGCSLKGAEYSVRSAPHLAAGQEELYRGGEVGGRNAGEPWANFLVGRILDPLARDLLPVADQSLTKGAVSVENKQRTVGKVLLHILHVHAILHIIYV